MINKYRLKIMYNKNTVTIDVKENINFKKLSELINEKLLLNKCNHYEFVLNNEIINSTLVNKEDAISKHLELEQEFIYRTGSKRKPYNIKVIVWDYIFDTSSDAITLFKKMVKKMEKNKPKQVYYLNKSQRKFIDIALNDCYEVLKSLNFGGKYNYQLLKQGNDYLIAKLMYYMLDDKYELYLYDSTDDLKEKDYKFLITFYDTNRAYFKGYQGTNRNIFVLCKNDETIRKENFEEIYSAINRITYMFNNVDSDYLFADHERSLIYDVANDQYWTEK